MGESNGHVTSDVYVTWAKKSFVRLRFRIRGLVIPKYWRLHI